MTWWQIVLLVLATSAGAAFLAYWLTKRSNKEILDRAALANSEKLRVEAVAAIQKKRTELLELATTALSAKLAETKQELAKRLEEIDDESKIERDRLIASTDALLGKIDSLLAIARSR